MNWKLFGLQLSTSIMCAIMELLMYFYLYTCEYVKPNLVNIIAIKYNKNYHDTECGFHCTVK